VQKKIDPLLDYPHCKQLFRTLLAPKGLQIEALVAQTAAIGLSSKRTDIAHIFGLLSEALRPMDPKKAEHAVRPLRDKAIFPLAKKQGSVKADFFSSAQDSSWLIGDRSHLRESFAGLVPLLALAVEELDKMEDVFKGLGLDSKRLSKLARKQSHPKGPLVYMAQKTQFFESRVQFIKVYVRPSRLRYTYTCLVPTGA
jgi:hypothetical protein